MVESATRELKTFDASFERSFRAPSPTMPPSTSFVPSQTSVVSGRISYQVNVEPIVEHRDAISSCKKPASAKLNSLSATIKYVEPQFVTIYAMVGNDPVEFKIARELCSDDIAREGMPVSVSIDDTSRYSSLRIERREKTRERSADLKKRFSAMEAWISAAE